MKSHRILLALLVATTVSPTLFGGEQPNRILQFIVRVLLPYTSSYNGTVSGNRTIQIIEAYDTTNIDDQKKIESSESNNLLQQCFNPVFDAHEKQQENKHSFQANGKSYAVEITPLLQKNNTCEKLTVIMNESQQ